MKNIDKLVDMVVHIERVLEKNIPTGYRQIVTEYVRQYMVPAIASAIAVIVGLIVFTYVLVQGLKLLKEYTAKGYNSRMGNLALIYVLLGTISLMFVLGFASYLATCIQHIVAPNWYIINGLIHK